MNFVILCFRLKSETRDRMARPPEIRDCKALALNYY